MTSILSGEFLLHIPCLLHFYLGSFSYTSRAGFNFISWLSLTHLMLVSFLPWEFLLYITSWLHFYLGIFSYTSRSGFIFMREVSLTHPMLTVFMWGVSLTHPVLPSLLCGEFFLHIRCCLDFYAGNFSYTSQAGLFFILFNLFIYFYLRSFPYRSRGSFSCTCCSGLMFSRGGFVTHPKRPSFICGEFLLHTLYWLLFIQGVVLHIACWRRFFFIFILGSFYLFYLGSFS